MSMSNPWEQERIPKIINLCGQYSAEASFKKDYVTSAEILISTGKFVESVALLNNMIFSSFDRAAEYWLNLKLTEISYAVEYASSSTESQKIILDVISLVNKFMELNFSNQKLQEHVVNISDDRKSLTLPEPFNSNSIF